MIGSKVTTMQCQMGDGKCMNFAQGWSWLGVDMLEENSCKKGNKKSPIRETPNLSTDMDSSININRSLQIN